MLEFITTFPFPYLVTQLMRSEQDPTVTFTQFIKDIYNLTTPERGLEIPDAYGMPLASDLSVSDIGASSSFTPPTSVHNQPLI